MATNSGNVTLHNVVVTDAQVTDLECEPALPVATLAVGASITCTASHTIVQADLDAGFFFNEACVDDGEGGAAEVCDDVTVPGQQAGGETDIPTQPPTDGSLGGGNAGPAGSAWLLVIALGIMLAVTVLVTPNRKRKEVKNS